MFMLQFSAATGTPLHPDKSERDLLDEAKKDAEKATYNKVCEQYK